MRISLSALVALLKGRLEGMLTEEEFENAKKQLLAEAAPPPSAAAPATPSLLPEQFFWARASVIKGTP